VSAELAVPLARVCPLNGAARSTIYHRRARGDAPRARPGPKTEVSDEALTDTIRQVITECPFAGEGHRKVRARLRREHQLAVGKNRVLRLMREAGLLAPQRAAKRRRPRLHDGKVITDAPNVRWGTDATMAWTKNDGWVWVFALLDHYSDEAWAHVAKVGNRFAALQPVYDAVIDRFGGLGPDVARGIKLRHDWGSQYRSGHFQGSLTWLGIQDDAAFVGEPQGNGVAERFMRTLKEQCLWSRLFEDTDDLRQGVATFIETYNNEWLIERLGHRTPREAFNEATTAKAA
jgi:transposase InsO family protein